MTVSVPGVRGWPHHGPEALAAVGLCATIGAALFALGAGLGAMPVAATLVAWVAIGAVVSLGVADHPYPRFGAANAVTTVRAGMTAILAGLVPVAEGLSVTVLWWVTALAVIAVSLDGLDGWLARRRAQCSDFGARFDMEIDALLGAVMSLLLWRTGEAGIWVLALGVLRYAFLLAGRVEPALLAPLFPSMRRKLVCVVQVGALAACLSPWLQPPVSHGILLLALLALVASFARDVHWLLSQR